MSKLKAIRHIDRVKNFSGFSTSHDLNKKNVIYAPTGVGKTNLSRFLHAISDATYDLATLKSKEAAESDEIQFQITLQNDTVLDQDNYTTTDVGPIVVYNADYVELNIRSQQLAEDDISGELEIELGDEHKRLSELEAILDEKEHSLVDIENELRTSLDAKRDSVRARDPRGMNTLKPLTYDNVTEDTYRDYTAQRSEWQNAWEHLEKVKDTDAEDKIDYTVPELNWDELDINWIEQSLPKSLEFPAPPIGELKEYLDGIASQWIEDGLKYHRDDEEERCPFCRKSKDDDFEAILRKYKEYVASEEVAFKNKCEEQIRHLEALQGQVSGIARVDLQRVVKEKAKSLGENVSWSCLETSKVEIEIEQLIQYLEQKRDAPSASIGDATEYDGEGGEQASDITKPMVEALEEVERRVKSNASAVQALNASLDDLSRRKAILRTAIGKGELVEFYTTHKTRIDKRDAIATELQELKKDVRNLKRKLPSVDAAERLVDLFNTFIARMGINKYQAEVKAQDDGTKRIVLRLHEQYDMSATVNEILSEGEKDAVSLSYFLASLILRLRSLDSFGSAAIVIDDPVNSLNYSHFYGVCSVIKTFVDDIKRALGGSGNDKNPQIVILTHNIQFYNMVLANVYKRGASYYELEEANGTHTLRRLTDDEKLSSFRTALRRIKGYADEDHKENIGNDIRKVLETVCRFHGYKLNRDSVKEVFSDQEVNDALLMFAHDQSHADVNDFNDPFDGDMYKELAEHMLKLMSPRYSKIIDELPTY